MNSGGHRGFTVVTIVTLVFAPIFSHHHWMWKLVGKTEQTQIVQCAPKTPCPKRKHVVTITTVGQPSPTPPRGKSRDDDDSGAVDDPAAIAKAFGQDDH
jgi:hypothetical protein